MLVSAICTEHIRPFALSSNSNPRLPRPETGHTWFNLSTDVRSVWVKKEGELLGLVLFTGSDPMFDYRVAFNTALLGLLIKQDFQPLLGNKTFSWTEE